MAQDLREITFQNVLDSILTPAGVKVGGFPHELFVDLNDEEKEKWSCGICFLIVNECRLCDNRHAFCRTCILAWSMTYGENSQKCPMCRCDQAEYLPDKETCRNIENKRVKCLEDNCSFRAPLKIFLLHSHGKSNYSNAHVDFEKLKNARPSAPRLLLLPGVFGGRGERGVGIRSQLQQGRAMIHQMMMLLHLEMQLRQQALTSYQEANDPVLRLRRLDEVLALNEQLNEVGGILSALLNTPLQASVTTSSSGSDIGEAMVTVPPSGGGLSTTIRHSPTRIMGARGLMNPIRDETDDDDDDDSGSDSSDDDVTSARRHFMAQRQSTTVTPRTPQPPSPAADSPSPVSDNQVDSETPRWRSEIRQDLLQNGTSSSASANSTRRGSSSLQQRVLLNRRQTSSEATSTRHQVSTTTTVQRLGPRSSVTDVVETETDESPSQNTRGSVTLPNIRSSPGSSMVAASRTPQAESHAGRQHQSSSTQAPQNSAPQMNSLTVASPSTSRSEVSTNERNPGCSRPVSRSEDSLQRVTVRDTPRPLSRTRADAGNSPSASTGARPNSVARQRSVRTELRSVSSMNETEIDSSASQQQASSSNGEGAVQEREETASRVTPSSYQLSNTRNASINPRLSTNRRNNAITPRSSSQASAASDAISRIPTQTRPKVITRRSTNTLNRTVNTRRTNPVPSVSSSNSPTNMRRTNPVSSMTSSDSPQEDGAVQSRNERSTANRSTNATKPKQNGRNLPTTPGQLMRARRRSEIHEQLLSRDRSDEN